MAVAAHRFVSSRPDGSDDQKVRASNWNAAHVFAGGTHGAFLTRDTTDGDGASWTFGQTVVNVKNYGAAGNGINDDTSAIQTALLVGGCVYLPAGTYKITSTLLLNDVRSVTLAGAGPVSSILQWAGNSTSAAIELRSAHSCTLRDFGVHVASPYTLKAAIWLYTKPLPRTNVSKHAVLQHLDIGGISNQLGIGVRIGGSILTEGVSDGNNDFHHLTDVHVANYSGVAFSMENSQVYGIHFDDCSFSTSAAGAHGISTRDNPDGNDQGGNFRWSGGGGNCLGTVFRLGAFGNGSYLIQHCDFEQAAMLLETSGPSGSTFKQTILDGVSYRAPGALPVDGVPIRYKFGGMFAMRNCTIGNDTGAALKFDLLNLATSVYVIEQCVIYSSFTTVATLIPSIPNVIVRASILQTGAGATQIGDR